MTDVVDVAVMKVEYYARCQECRWTGANRTNKDTAKQDRRQHDRECH